jgi:bifunctional non-homologous end joining protein LigD
MLCTIGELPAGDDWVFQPKWDGVRAQIEFSDGTVTGVWSRNGTPWTATVGPVLTSAAPHTGHWTLDGELIVTGGDGRPDFAAVLAAVHDPNTARQVTFVAFDILVADTTDMRRAPWTARHDALTDRTWPSPIVVTATCDDGPALFDATRNAGLEGVVAKRRTSTIVTGRSRCWVKTKHWRRGTFAATSADRDGRIRVAVVDHGRLRDVGAAFNALTGPDRAALTAAIRHHRHGGPVPCVEVRYLDWTPRGRLRHAVVDTFAGVAP